MNKRTKDIFMYIIAGGIISYSFVFLYFLLFKEIPTENRDVLMTLSGTIVGGGFMAVIGYFFGSTKGSSDKTEMIANNSHIREQQKYEALENKQENNSKN